MGKSHGKSRNQVSNSFNPAQVRAVCKLFEAIDRSPAMSAIARSDDLRLVRKKFILMSGRVAKKEVELSE